MTEFLIRFLMIPAGAAAMYGSWRAIRSIDITRGIAWPETSRPRFQLVDFMSLFLMMQIPLLLLTLFVRTGTNPNPGFWVVGIVYAAVYAGIWWWGVAALSAIEVNSTVRRAVFLGLLQPLGMGLIPAGGAALLMALPMAWNAELPLATRAFGGMLVYTVAAVVYSLACDWVRAGSERLHPKPPSEDEVD